MSKLIDLCVTITDGEHGTVNDDLNGKYFLLSSKNIANGSIIISENDRKISEKTFNALVDKTSLDIGDVVISSVGTLGKTCVIDEKPNYVFQRSVGIIKPNSKILNSYYLKYQLDLPSFQKRLEFLANGGLQKGLYIGDLERLDINCPDVNTQNKISRILKIIDDKRKTNNKINAELESMAKTLYDYWFLQFEFPNKEGKPYKSSGGKMVYNEELKREIPRGWTVKHLKDLVYLGNDEKYNGKNIATLDLSVMPSNSISLNEINDSDNFDMNLFKMKKYDILFGSIRPYLKKAGIAPCDGAFTGTVHCFRCYNDEFYNFSLFTLCCENMFDYAYKNSKGSKMPVVGSDRLFEYPIPYNEEIIKRFNSIDIKNIIATNVMENQELSLLRDFLLPLLMNGQVTIK